MNSTTTAATAAKDPATAALGTQAAQVIADGTAAAQAAQASIAKNSLSRHPVSEHARNGLAIAAVVTVPGCLIAGWTIIAGPLSVPLGGPGGFFPTPWVTWWRAESIRPCGVHFEADAVAPSSFAGRKPG
jgi:hypothetical protein